MARKTQSPPELPKYSEDGANNKDLFLVDRNDALIYFEDEGYEELYLRLIKKLSLPVAIKDVFCLGGKSALITRCREAAPKGKRRLFVADKDFDDLLGKIIDNPDLMYLGRYCFENYFLDKELFVEYVLDKKKRHRREQVETTSGIDDYSAKVAAWYAETTRYFIVALRFRLPIETTKGDVSEMCDIGTGERNAEWWRRFVADFTDAVHVHQRWLLEGTPPLLEHHLESAFQANGAAAAISDGTPWSHLCGKQLLSMYLQRLKDLFALPEGSDDHYAFMMQSVERIPEAVFAPLRAAAITILTR